MIKTRINYEKISFLKALPQFKVVSQPKVKAMIDQFRPLNKIRGSYLFQEGEIVTHIYIVVSGEFKVLKRIGKERLQFD